MTPTLREGITADDVLAGLADIQKNPLRRGSSCSVHVALEHAAEVDPEVAEVLRVAFDNDTIPASRLQVLVQGLGLSVSEFSIQRHRRRLRGGEGCKCRTTT